MKKILLTATILVLSSAAQAKDIYNVVLDSNILVEIIGNMPFMITADGKSALPDGVYATQDGTQFTVAKGRIKGDLPPETIQ